MAEFIPANILIGDRTYRLRIEPGDEEKLRKTAKLINEKIMEFKTAFAGKDMQDYIAMVLLWFSSDQNKNSNEWLQLENASEKIRMLENMIDRTLADTV